MMHSGPNVSAISYNFTSSFQDDEEYQSDTRLRRYYIGGNKDCTTQVEYYGAKVNFGVKFAL